MEACYGTPLATLPTAPAKLKSGGQVTLAVRSGEPAGRIVIMEDQSRGQRVRSFQVDVKLGSEGETPSWQPLLKAESIGHKRIIALNTSQTLAGNPRVLSAVRLTVVDAVGTATIRSMAVFAESGCALPPAPPSPPCQLVADYEYTGAQVGAKLGGQSVALCCSACRAKAHCVGFARTAAGQCTLFKALGGGSVVPGSTSGSPAQDDAASAPVGLDSAASTQALGNGLSSLKTDDRAASAIDLDATPWQFAPDPLGVGVSERWYDTTARAELERTIITPGAWEAQGVGNATELMHSQYLGVGWYRKTVHLPAEIAAGSSLWLWIGGAPGGVMRSANVWANGAHVGRHVGYLEPLHMDLTHAVGSSTTVTVAVAVDSRWNRTEDPLWGSGSLWNYGGSGAGGGGGDGYSFGGYGGIVGHARLLLRQRAYFEDSVLVTCSPATGSASATAVAAADWTCDVQFTLVGNVSPTDSVSVQVCSWNDPAAPCVSKTASAATHQARMQVSLTIEDAQLWVPGTREYQANLYIASIELSSKAATLDQRQTRFGCRQVRADGPRVEFNGEAVFLRGYGDDGNYATTAAPPMDKDFYLRQLTSMKALGYNFIRFHTHSMPTELFDAADEVHADLQPALTALCSRTSDFAAALSPRRVCYSILSRVVSWRPARFCRVTARRPWHLSSCPPAPSHLSAWHALRPGIRDELRLPHQMGQSCDAGCQRDLQPFVRVSGQAAQSPPVNFR